jgi:putative transposase
MSRTLIALFADYAGSMRECKRLVRDQLAEVGRQLTGRLINEALQAEMDEHCRATWHERAPERRDRRNGAYRRTLRTRLGPLALVVPRSRSGRFRSRLLPRARQVAPELDQGVRQLYLKGVSTRQVGALIEVLCGSGVSASTVSRITRALDAELARFQRRPLKDRYRYLLLDAVYLPVKKARGAKREPLLVAYAIDAAAQRQVLDLRLARSESEAAWTQFLTSLYTRGLGGERLELIITDGGQGLIQAVETVWPLAARQRCWAHMMRNLVGACPKRLAQDVAKAARKIYLASTRREALARFAAFRRRFESRVPKAVGKIERALDELVAFFGCPPSERRAVRTTNAIERLFVELRRRLRPMGCLPDAACAQRIGYAVCAAYNGRRHRLRPEQHATTAQAA